MKKFIFGFAKNKSVIVPPSDLVALGILPKQVSEYTDADIGSIISIPYTDSSGIITGPIEFEVVGVNHHKDIYDESKPTITLMSKNIIRNAAFDAAEPDNPLHDEAGGRPLRAEGGNNRWSVSNIRQWLNSESGANEWFTLQHEYDTPPIADNIWYYENAEYAEYGSYADEAGFLAGFSDEVKQHFATVRNKTILCNADKLTLSKDFEETEDKVFLPSRTEMGFGNFDDNNPEGSHLDKMFKDDESRIKSGGDAGGYWMRTPYPVYTDFLFCSDIISGMIFESAASGRSGPAPLIVLY
jgi:hypothetical protein